MALTMTIATYAKQWLTHSNPRCVFCRIFWTEVALQVDLSAELKQYECRNKFCCCAPHCGLGIPVWECWFVRQYDLIAVQLSDEVMSLRKEVKKAHEADKWKVSHG